MTTAKKPAPNIMFSHMGISVRDIALMERFYTEFLGFSVTDRGEAAGMQIVFLSRNPIDHHQIVLATGRPETMPTNTANPQFGPSINQISFRVGSLADLRYVKERLEEGGAADLFPANHGIAWSIYAHDPEGNNLEFFVDTPWYIKQPFLLPLDLMKSDDEIVALTKSMCEQGDGYVAYEAWRSTISEVMTPYTERVPVA